MTKEEAINEVVEQMKSPAWKAAWAKHPPRKGKIDLVCPPDWRQGQTIMNFLNWINQNEQIRCPVFYMEDDEWERLYKEFITQYL